MWPCDNIRSEKLLLARNLDSTPGLSIAFQQSPSAAGIVKRKWSGAPSVVNA
jgi:hypothetical protein